MKCKCGQELISDGLNGMCWECYCKHNREIDNSYIRTEKLNTGWECPKCGYIWAPQVEGCDYCNVPQYEIKSTDGTNHANKTKP